MENTCPTERPDKILLSTDGSEFSEGAVREAISLAKKCGSELTALTVFDTNDEFETIAPQLAERKAAAARQTLDAVQTRAKREGVACNVIVHSGEEVYGFIVDEAVKNRCGMIVMGRRGRTGLNRLVMGSVTARVIGHAPCNVLVVPRAATVQFRSIVVATDGSRHSASAVDEAVGLAKRNGSALTVVSVVPSEIATSADVDFTMNQNELIAEREMREAEKNAKTAKEAALKAGVAAKAFILSGKPADAIIETAKDAQADLIVVGSHGRTGLEKLLMGSVAERVIVLSSCPVLVVKTK
jgi:nucleotide-binding universal stress UspA family protein